MNDHRYQIGDLISGRYEVRQIIPGGMGIVYICQDNQEKIPFALKTFYDKYLLDKGVKERFIQEALTWINLHHHANIVQAERADIIGGKPFIVLECVLDEHGVASDLATKLANESLEPRKILNYAIQICLGMNHVHAKNPRLIHRDIKPSNILISHDDLAKISDFGISTAIRAVSSESLLGNISGEQSRTRAGEIMGTPDYMSPEQYHGKPLNISSDIYSFGCVLYEMLTGEKYIRQMLLLQSNQQTELFSGLHPDIASVLRRCLAYEPTHRFQSFYEAGEALEKCYKSISDEDIKIEVRFQIMPGLWFPSVESSFKNAVNFTKSHDMAIGLGNYVKNFDLAGRGTSLMKLGLYEEALECFECLIKEGDLESGLINKANVLGAMGRGKEAVNCYKEAVSINPKNHNAWYNLAENLFNVLQDPQGAAAAYQKTLQLNPKDDMAWNSLGFVLSKMGNINEAIKCYDKSIEINPNMIHALGNKASALLEKGMKTEALKYSERIISIDSGIALAWFYRAISLSDDHLAEKVISLERASELDPGHGIFKLTLEGARDALARKTRKVTLGELIEIEHAEFFENEITGLEKNLNDRLCINCTIGFIRYLEKIGDLKRSKLPFLNRSKSKILIGAGSRPGTDRILRAIGFAIDHAKYKFEYIGKTTTAVLLSYAYRLSTPCIMVTSSKNSREYNGIQFYPSSNPYMPINEYIFTQFEVELL